MSTLGRIRLWIADHLVMLLGLTAAITWMMVR